MAIDLKLPEATKPQKLSVHIDGQTYEELQLYLQSAQEEIPSVSLDFLVQHMLMDRMKKDRSFRAWRVSRKKDSGASNDAAGLGSNHD